LGIKSTTSKSGREKIILWIADPHKNSREDGLYFLVLDKNSGDKLHSTGMDKDEHGNSNGLETSQSIYPNKKGWMLLFPQKSVAISQNQAPSSSTVSSSTDDVLRVKYPSFEMYQQERNDQGDPVDLIIGRGTRHTTSNPKLNETRYLFFEQTYRPYRPFTVDINPAVEPDFEGSVIDLKQMGYFPDASVDDIYLERLFPPSMLIDVQIYCNAARILKLFGTLIADFNDRKRTEFERQKQVEGIRSIFADLHLPFKIALDDPKKPRNDLSSCGFICTKYEDFDQNSLPTTGEIVEANRKVKLFFENNKIGFT
jgi:hypothetical protein